MKKHTKNIVMGSKLKELSAIGKVVTWVIGGIFGIIAFKTSPFEGFTGNQLFCLPFILVGVLTGLILADRLGLHKKN